MAAKSCLAVTPSGGSGSSRTGGKPLQPANSVGSGGGRRHHKAAPQAQHQQPGNDATFGDLAALNWRPAERPWLCNYQDASFTLEVRCASTMSSRLILGCTHFDPSTTSQLYQKQDEAATAAAEATASCCALIDPAQQALPLVHVSAGFEALAGSTAADLVGRSCLKASG